MAPRANTVTARALAALLACGAVFSALASQALVPAVVAVGPVLRLVLLVVATLLLMGATWLWRTRPSIGLAEVALAMISIAVGIVMLEGGVRLREHMANLNGERYLRDDRRLGWTLQPTLHAVHRGRRFTTTIDTLRARLNAGAARRVVIVGDSYTQAVQVDDDSSYWAQLARRRPDLEIIVMGVGGYAMLQEQMEIQRLDQSERPSLIIWQLCGNDLIGNDYLLEAASLWNNNARRRPYLERGGLVYRNPRAAPSLEWSALYRIVASHIAVLRVERLGARSIELDLHEHPTDLARARATTYALFARAQRAVGTTPLLAFLADDDLSAREIASVARNAGATMLPVPAVLDRARRLGADLAATSTDAHWNGRAHALAAAMLDSAVASVLPRQ